jgi:hypothetical protein
MASKSEMFSRVMDPRPGVFSGVLAAKPTIGLHGTLEAAIAAEEVMTVGDRDWYKGQMHLARGVSPAEAFEGTVVRPDHLLVAMYSEDLVVATRRNVALGAVDQNYLDAVSVSVNKTDFFERVASQGLRMPFVQSTDAGVSGVERILEQTALTEVVVKPRSGTGSVGVFRGKTVDRQAFLRDLQFAVKGMSDQTNLVVMGVVDSGKPVKELAINSIVIDGALSFTAVHAKVSQSLGAPFRDFVIASHDMTGADADSLGRMLPRVVDAVGMRHGVLQVEARPDATGEWIPIDVSMRPDGGLMPDCIRATTGVDLRLAQVYCQIGRIDLLRTLVGAARPQKQKSAAAIGAFYGTRLSEAALVELLRATRTNRLGDLELERIYFRAEQSNLAMAPAEVQAAFCVTGASQAVALEKLYEAGARIGLRSGAEWLDNN